MKLDTRRLFNQAVAAVALFCMATQSTFAVLLSLSNQPLFIGSNIPPQVMLTISKDQQLFKKAYNDYSDLDNPPDGVLDTTYKNTITYYGYFDSTKCYDYVNPGTANARFDPFGTADAQFYCVGGNAGKWSGNFLNWVSMTRMDTVRKLLYGGYRSTDTATDTVLERAYLPTDAHSFAKFYAGQIDQTTGAVIDNDIARLTPFAGPAAVQTTSATTQSISPSTASAHVKTFTVPSTTGFQAGHQVQIRATAGAGAGAVMRGPITSIVAATSITVFVDTTVDGAGASVPGGPCSAQPLPGGCINTGTAWTIDDLTMRGLTFCNTTLGGPTGPLGNTAAVVGNANNMSQTNTNAPLIRVASGDYALWAAQERFQCYFQEEATTQPARSNVFGPPIGAGLGTRSNGNRGGFSGMGSGAFEPTRAANGLGQIDYAVRVKACVTGMLGQERCKQYPNGTYKPIGLLQEYGDVDLINFGLMTGSYNKNVSGGVLRKNVGSFKDEVNTTTDGTFKVPANGGIVRALNAIRIIGYAYFRNTAAANNSGTYREAFPNGDSCDFQLTNITEGNCRSWASPVSEIYFESLRYFAGQTAATAAFAADDSTISGLSNLVTAPWPSSTTQVLSNNNFCSPINILVFNASVSTNEDDAQIPAASLSQINGQAGQTVITLTNTVGSNEPGVEAVRTANQFFFGKSIGDTNANPGFELCSAKSPTTNGLGDVIGICPEGPTVGGTYHVAGLAYHARINQIRSDLTVPATDTKSLRVTTYGISLATNVPTLPIRVLGDAQPRAIIQPIYRLARLTAPAGYGGGGLVDMKLASQTVTATASRGSIYVNWDDSEQGGDYDQDLWGMLQWCLKLPGDTTVCPASQPVNTIAVTTQAIAESTNQPQGFGYVVSGTTKDGAHFTSGIGDTPTTGFNFCDTTDIAAIVTPTTKTWASGSSCQVSTTAPFDPIVTTQGGGCKNCQVSDGPVTTVYPLSAVAAARNLRDPLYYAAKYGAFTDSNGNNLPDLQSEWDTRTTAGAQGTDGIPDTYFLVSNPNGLVSALDRAFISILSNASASSVATNSTSLQTGTTIYQARFNANDWSGQVLAFPVSTATGLIQVDPLWDAGQIINSQDPSSTVAPATTSSSTVPGQIAGAGRTILTYNDVAKQGVAFRWPETSPAQPATTCTPPVAGSYGPNTITAGLVDALNKDAVGNVDNRGCRRLEWLRGDQLQEGATATGFRVRPVSRLGDIVNSDPNFVSVPNAGFGDSAYATFRQANISRPAMIYVGGNDGMLHGFRASDGRELLAYVPSKVRNKLSRLMDKTYTAALQHRYFVDASPEISDAFINVGGVDQWRTVLVSGLGGGGQGLFALDITSPTTFTEGGAGPSNVVLWEFNDADDPNLGFVTGQPIIRKMANGKWAAIISGGYNNARPSTTELPEVTCTSSTTSPPVPAGCTTNTNGGRAYLYVIFLNGPTGPGRTWQRGVDYVRISSGVGGDNGLAPPLAADINGDGVIDYVYAGDLQGNMHKFSVTDPDPNQWGIVTNRTILFTATDSAGNVQPITAKPEATLHPTGFGFLIAFGTGKYLENTDPCPPGGCPPAPATDYQVESFYGIWDKNDNPTISLQTVVTARNQLLQQTITNVAVGVNTFRVLSTNVPDWFTDPLTQSSPTKDLGWYMDFPNGTTTGERSVFRPILTSGRLIFTTLLPLTNACEFGGTSFLMVVDPTTGGRIDAAVLNTDTNPALNASDKVTVSPGNEAYASGVQSTIGITPTPTIIRAAGSSGNTQNTSSQILGTSGPLLAGAGFLLAYALAAGSSGGNASTMIGLSASGGRVSWRELLN